MPHTSAHPKADTVTFRIDPALKEELTRLAAQDQKTLGALMRDLARERVVVARRRAFEAEARRQAGEAATEARRSGTDEHEVMRELEADLDAFGDEWK